MIPAWAKRLHAPMGLHVGGVDGRFVRMMEGKKWVLNIGAKRMGAGHWINLDIVRHAPSINLLGDAHHLPLRDGTVDGAVCKFVLEHVPDPARVVAEVLRVLKPGGVFFVAVPFVEPFHLDPGDYQRYSVDGLKRLCAGFRPLEAGAYFGPASALVEVLREFVAAFFDTVWLKKAVRLVAGWVFLPIKFLDLYLGRKRSAADCAYGVYMIGQKEG